MLMKNRRSLLRLLAGAALLSGAGSATAERTKSVTVAYLALLPGEDRTTLVANFMRRLNELGYVDGHNLRFAYRSAEGRPELLPGLASELLQMKPDVLVTGFGTVAAKAAKAAAGDAVPVIFMAVGDPVGAGIVASLARPGGNVTGLSDLAAHLQGNRLQLLREITPAASHFAAILNPGTPYAALAYKDLEDAAKVAKVQLQAFEVHTSEEIAPQLEAARAAGTEGLVVFEDPLTLSERDEIAALASRLRLPAVYGYREFAEAGGLMSYGTDHGAQWRRGAEIVDLVIKGAKPADIPVEQPTKFELVVNLRTAKTLDLTFPPTIMVRADDTIE
jgi:putative tryptophan/tyrosine transport system substrate-binding protein